MAGIGKINLNVAVVDSDRYAMSAINAYFAWDRRTTVIYKTGRLEEFWANYQEKKLERSPDVFVIDANHLGGAALLCVAIERLRAAFPDIMVICLAQFADLDLLHAAAEAGAKAYWLKDDVRLHIGWAVCACLCLEEGAFSISNSVVEAGRKLSHRRLGASKPLPGPRGYIGFTPRVRQAAELYVVEGMPVRLIANEMGLGESTVRGYIKQSYSILESVHGDEKDYQDTDMSQQEVGFMRLTALELSEDCLESLRDYRQGERGV